MRFHALPGAALIVLLALTASSCTVTEPIEFGEQRRLVLETVADSLIKPGYEVLVQRCDSLENAIKAFAVQPTQSNLDITRAAWTTALLSWERVVTYDFGPAIGNFGSLNTDIATFPASVQKIEAAIAAGDNATQDFNRDKRGLFALEYLLFSEASQPIVNPDSIRRRAYLKVVARHLDSSVRAVRADWINYRSRFVEQIGTDAGSSMSLLFNALNMSYEQAKNYKIAIPAGRRLGQTQAPHLVEAYYSGTSVRALKVHIRSVFELWSGNEPSLHGFQYYLGFVPQGQRLIDDTKKQMDSVNIALDAINDAERLSDLITSNDPRVEALVEQTQKMSRYLKSELSSLIGISITYSSGDGD